VTWGAAGAGTIVRLRRSPNGRVRPLCFIVRHLEDAPCSMCREAPLSATALLWLHVLCGAVAAFALLSREV